MNDIAEMLGPGWEMKEDPMSCPGCGKSLEPSFVHPFTWPFYLGLKDGFIEAACNGAIATQRVKAVALLGKAGIILGECVGQDEQGHTFWTWSRA